MRSPEHRQLAQPRAGRDFEEDLQLHYLSPGAFTVLPSNNLHPPDPPTAPEPYRLTPSTRRHKNQSFAVIGDVDPTKLLSRSSSPSTGRVSPFKGRGFNPRGSRHVSPSISPTPPEDARLTPTDLSPRHSSKIPKLKRRPSNGAFGEKVYHYNSSPTKRKISNKLSQSLTDLQADKNGNKPPVASKRTYSKKPAFQRLSPIIGSSPEPSQSMSSPSRIPKSHSTPPSRKISPSRETTSSRKGSPSRDGIHPDTGQTSGKPPVSKTPTGNRSRNSSQNASRNQSRNHSREPSPTKTPTSPSRIPVTKYGKVQAKVNSFKKAKSQVPLKNHVVSEQSDDTDASKNKSKTPLNRKHSVSKIRTNSRPNLLPKTGNYGNNYASTSDSLVSNTTNKTQVAKKTVNDPGKAVNGQKDSKNGKNNSIPIGTSDNKTSVEIDKTKIDISNNDTAEESAEKITSNNDIIESDKEILDKSSSNDKDVVFKKADQKPEQLPSTTTVVSSTTSTVAQPLKIDTNLNFPHHYEGSKPISPMVDGRVLSATSVSNAINKMNDTVLDSQTVMKDHGFSKPSPAASTIISVAKEANKSSTNPALDTKNATTALPTVEPYIQSVGGQKEVVHQNSNHSNNHTNNVSHVMSSKALEMEVQKHMQKLITPEHTMSETLRKSRTVIASDVEPIRITVREKPSDVEVQSGNIRLPVSATNGVNERPSLPPSQSIPPPEPEKQPPPKNGCTKFFTTCRKKMCKCCDKKEKSEKKGKSKSPVSCFNCLKKKKNPPATIVIEDEVNKKTNCFDRLKCCKTKKIGDLSCFPKAKRKESWAERRDSILCTPTPPKSKCSKDCCEDVLRKIFCINLCCKKKVVEVPVRKASIISKKKSLTPTTAPPPEDTTPKIDLSLVEHSSHMKAAIPILPICLAWFCLVLNCLLPGTGTVFSGLFCLCIGIPRFSQKDGPRARIGSFIINCIIGFSQFFTVLFCLVGWGWSIWWGVIMLKVAKKHKRFKHLEAIEQANITHQLSQNNSKRDPENRP